MAQHAPNEIVTTQKDTIFRMIFSRKKDLLALYNAIRQSNYSDPNLLEIKTLDNAIYMNIKNDLSFLIDTRLNLFEHQSTYNPNLPLRDLFYVADQLHELVIQADLYREKLVEIPTPEFVVFYNGIKKRPERKILKLSDSFQVKEKTPSLELLVTMLNINVGCNQDLMQNCKTLRDYSLYVETVRTYSKTMDMKHAVEQTVAECIQKDILKDFLLSQRAEAIKMTIYEYDEALHEAMIKQDAYDDGFEKGHTLAMQKLISKKLAKGKSVSQIADELEEAEQFIQTFIAENEL